MLLYVTKKNPQTTSQTCSVKLDYKAGLISVLSLNLMQRLKALMALQFTLTRCLLHHPANSAQQTCDRLRLKPDQEMRRSLMFEPLLQEATVTTASFVDNQNDPK